MDVTRSEATSVRFFEQLYAIVVGLGLAVAVEQVIDLQRAIPVTFEHVPVFFAYLNLAFALAHSSVRYLELAYVDQLVGPLGKGRVLGDIVLGIGQFLWLIGLSFLITRPIVFAWGTIGLLIGRPIRDAFVAVAGHERLEFDRKVAVMHAVTIAWLLGAFLTAQLVEAGTALWVMRVATLGASLLFGIGLYLSAFEFFFPVTTPD